jgi:hypothetical protein
MIQFQLQADPEKLKRESELIAISLIRTTRPTFEKKGTNYECCML